MTQERDDFRKLAHARYLKTVDLEAEEKWWKENLNKENFWIEGSLAEMFEEELKKLNKLNKRGIKHAG